MANFVLDNCRRNRRRNFGVIVLLGTALILAACGGSGNNAFSKNANPSNTFSDRRNSELVDLNSASKTQLISLPGIGEVNVQKIIDGRPYRDKRELVRRNIIPEKTYEMFSEKVIAKQD